MKFKFDHVNKKNKNFPARNRHELVEASMLILDQPTTHISIVGLS
jgi:hypothetical protein